MSLKSLRKKAGITQQKACSEIGIAISTLCRWETGNGNIPAYAVSPMSQLYGVDEHEILNTIGEMERLKREAM